MELKRGHWFVTLFTLAYMLAYSVYYISIKNYEFLWYIFILVSFFALIVFTINKSKFDYLILWGLSIWGLLHMSGGGLIINGDVLYNLKIIHLFDMGDTFVFKFDQLVHIFGFFFTSLVAFHLLKGQVKGNVNWTLVYIASALISMGLGVVNEIVEFIATVSIEEVNVGGYYNTMLDLISNTIGAFLAVFLMRERKK
jgi:VanZ family protein